MTHPMIPADAVDAAAKGLASANLRSRPWNELAEDAQNHFRRDAKAALEAAAPHMLAGIASDEVLAILESAGVDKVNQFDALVAVQKLAENRK